MTIPTRGMCHSVFLLAYAARTKPRRNTNEWVAGAQRLPTLMAEALGLNEAANLLRAEGLAWSEQESIMVDQRLVHAGSVATAETLGAIAKVLLQAAPPPWVKHAIRGGKVRWELVPSADARDLVWLGDLLEPLLLDLQHDTEESDRFRTWLGGVGESFLVASETARGAKVRHVALVSDAFGYDVESVLDAERLLIEVKTTVERNAGTFMVTKNEARSAATLAPDWVLMQVILKHSAIVDEHITLDHVVAVRSLRTARLEPLLPRDTPNGEWTGSARITAPDDAWTIDDYVAPTSWSVDGYRS